MTHRQMIVTYTDGTSAVTQVERNDELGRKVLEHEAFLTIARPDVASVSTQDVDRTYATGRWYR